MEKDLEYKLDEELPELKDKLPKKAKKIIIILIIIIVLLLIGFITLLFFYLSDKKNKKKTENKSNDGNKEDYDSYDSLIRVIYNISYGYNNIIINSFKKGAEHYNESLGNVNGGLDYEVNGNNIYDMYIPYTATLRKKKYNKIFLIIHGGAWVGGYRTHFIEECKDKAKLGYIAVNFEYTFLKITGGDSYNIFRILDEITAVQEGIKRYLELEGFDVNKLEMCIGGASAGAHLSLLYAYWFKKSPIPIKFVYNLMAPISLEFDYWWFLKDGKEPLNNIEPDTIEIAKKNGTIEDNREAFFNNTVLTALMNLFLGRPTTDNMDKMMIDDYEIDTNSSEFQNLLSIVKIAFPVYHVDKNTLPTLCAYGGKDLDVGINQYAYLKKEFQRIDNNNIFIVYSKYSNHSGLETITEEGKNSKMFLDLKFYEFTEKYFSKD